MNRLDCDNKARMSVFFSFQMSIPLDAQIVNFNYKMNILGDSCPYFKSGMTISRPCCMDNKCNNYNVIVLVARCSRLAR